MYYVFVFLGAVILFVSLVLFLKYPFFNLASSAAKQLDIILDKSIGERDKDQRILRNLRTLLKDLFLNLCIFTLILICSILPALLYTKYNLDRVADSSSIYFFLCMILGSFSLLIFKKKSDYTYWSKLLHTLVLDNYKLGNYLFEREIKVFSKGNVFAEKQFVIVTGLARGGTTALTNLLFDEGVFHSINYANVPFLLAPNIWKKIYNPKSSKKKVRAHEDKVLISENSIEALEEYFFKVFLKDSYIYESCLKKHEVTKELLYKYYQYQELFRKNKNTIYLAKNNNFLLRYESIAQQNKLFKLVLIFREPLEHANSLLRQHKNFIVRQKEDNFVLKYMNWLGHYEFGLNQKHFSFEINDEILLDKYDKSELSFWLAIWCSYYSYVIKVINEHNFYLVKYEDLLQNPDGLLKALETVLEIQLKKEPSEQFKPRKYLEESLYKIDNELLVKAKGIYEDLSLKKLQITRSKDLSS